MFTLLYYALVIGLMGRLIIHDVASSLMGRLIIHDVGSSYLVDHFTMELFCWHCPFAW